VIYRARSSRRAAQVARSQLALRLALVLYSLLVATALLRIVIQVMELPSTVWSVNLILAASRPVTFLLTFVPGGGRVVLGSATLADLTATIFLLAAALPFLSRKMP
jgi:hypothetical protein